MQTLEDDDAVIEFLEDSGSSEQANGGHGGQQELVTKRMIKDERFCTLFGLTLSEKIVKSFPCFLVAEILIQGTMVITERHICFYSNIPGLKRNIKIRFADITRLTKEKVYAFFPTGIGVHSRKERVVFSYVTSRDKLLQLLHTQWESYSEVDEDFCSSARGSSVDEAPMDGQASSRDVSVLNDEDSGILVAPTATSVSTANSMIGAADSPSPVEERSAEDMSDTEDSAGLYEYDLAPSVASPLPAAAPRGSWSQALSQWLSPPGLLCLDWDGLPNKQAVYVVATLVLICAMVIVYLSFRLHSLQQQLLLVVSMRTGQGQSDVDHLNHKLGGIVETLGGLQEKLGNLRHLLNGLHSADNR